MLHNWIQVSAHCVTYYYYYIKFKTDVCVITHQRMLLYDARRLPPFYAETKGRASTAVLLVFNPLIPELTF
jgi:hypothetical protein